MLEECYDQVDGISLHNYYGNTPQLTGGRRVPLPGDEPRHGTADSRDRRRLRLRAGRCSSRSKRLWLSFDEWNVWYRARGGDAANGQRQFAPKLLEEEYNLEDALLVGGFINSLLRNSDRVRVGCLAQIVNVIAPLRDQRHGVLRQSIYYPYAWALKYARGRVLDLRVESETYPIRPPDCGRLRPRRAGAVRGHRRHARRAQNGQACVFMLNRDLDSEREVVLDWRDVHRRACSRARRSPAPTKAFNTFEQPPRRSPTARAASAREPDDVQAAGSLLHRRPARRRRAVQCVRAFISRST